MREWELQGHRRGGKAKHSLIGARTDRTKREPFLASKAVIFGLTPTGPHILYVIRYHFSLLFDQRTPKPTPYLPIHLALPLYKVYTFLHTLPRPPGTEWQLLGLFALRLSIHFVPRGLTFTLISLLSDPRHSFPH